MTNDNRKKALKLLTKLLKAAKQAQDEGKYFALGKIIMEANKLSSSCLKDEEENKKNFEKVQGELVSDIIYVRERTPEEAIMADLKPEHRNLAIIAAKKDFCF